MWTPTVRFGLPGDWSFWQPLAKEHVQRCDEVVVPQLDGWRESEGVQAEMALAAHMGQRVDFPVEWKTGHDVVLLSSRVLPLQGRRILRCIL